MEKIDMQIIMQIAIALGIVIVFRILSSLVSKVIIKILRTKNKYTIYIEVPKQILKEHIYEH